MKISDPFAFIVPKSKSAECMLKLRRNQTRVELTSKHDQLEGLSMRRKTLAILNLCHLLGRRYLSFGTSKLAGFALPPMKAISKRHFLLHFDLSTGELLLSDISRRGIWITTASEASDADGIIWEHVHQATCRITHQRTTIRVCEKLEFSIILTPLLWNRSQMPAAFERYVRSVKEARTSAKEQQCMQATRVKRRASEDLQEVAKRRRSSVMCF